MLCTLRPLGAMWSCSSGFTLEECRWLCVTMCVSAPTVLPRPPSLRANAAAGVQGGATPLHFAAHRGHVPAADWLIKHGLHVDATDKVRQPHAATVMPSPASA